MTTSIEPSRIIEELLGREGRSFYHFARGYLAAVEAGELPLHDAALHMLRAIVARNQWTAMEVAVLLQQVSVPEGWSSALVEQSVENAKALVGDLEVNANHEDMMALASRFLGDDVV